MKKPFPPKTMKEGSPQEEALDRKQGQGGFKAKTMPAFGKKKMAPGQKVFLKKK